MDYWQLDLNALVKTSQKKGYSQERSSGNVKAAIFLMDIIHDVLWTRAVNRDYFSAQVRYTAFLLVLKHGIRIYHGIPSPEIPTKHLDGFSSFTEPDQLWCLGHKTTGNEKKPKGPTEEKF